MTKAPPKLAQKILLRFLREDLVEEVLGDLEEKFHASAKSKSIFRAKVVYWYQVGNYIRPFAIKKLSSIQNNQFDMFQSYFKIGWRNLLRNRGYSLINIGGLALGMAVAILIGLWVYDELSFNVYHQNRARIARVMRNGTLNGETFTTSYLPYALGEELKTVYGGNFEHVVMAWPKGAHILSAGDLKFSVSGEFIESAGPEMFSLNMISGHDGGLNDPRSILLSASTARMLFGEEDPLNRLVMIDNKMDVRVTGVYEDLPHNSHFNDVGFFAPWDLFVGHNAWMTTQGFANNFLDIYVEVLPATRIEVASANIRDAIKKNVSDIPEFLAVSPEIFLHPMDEWYLYSSWKNGVNTGGRIQFVWLFGLVGAFVLLLACINFMNLSTARAAQRTKEVSIRKVMGSRQGQLIYQFFSESFIVVFVAFAVALVLVVTQLNAFNTLAGKQVVIPWHEAPFWLSCLLFIFLTGVLSGSYPALYLSSFQPASLLKGIFHSSRFSSAPRKVLVVIQFTVSVALVIGTIVVYQQIQFAKNRPVGYNRDGLIMVQMTSPDYSGRLQVLQDILKNSGVISDVALSVGPVTGVWSSNGGFEWRGKDPNLQAEFGTLSVSAAYGNTVGWEFLKGRDFSGDRASDSTGMIINQSAARVMGFADPVGEVVRWKPVWGSSEIDFTVLGVIEDMVMRDPYAPVMPTAFFLADNYNWINIRLAPMVTASEALPRIEAVFKKVVPAVPFDYRFADQEYALKFAAEERVGRLASVFSVLAIIISCLGLFGLASFIAEQRTKEIGIRKVVGASVFNLWKMLSLDFVVLVVVACVVAIPISYAVLSNWLLDYEYRTEISGWIFVLVVTGALAITLLTVSYHAIKAAQMNPVRSLRAE